jgi:hypothetical protein
MQTFVAPFRNDPLQGSLEHVPYMAQNVKQIKTTRLGTFSIDGIPILALRFTKTAMPE